MQRFVRPVMALVILAVVLGLTLIDVNAQTRRKRRPRRVTRVTRPVITNPAITPDGQTATDETKVLSTADDPTTEPTPVETPRTCSKPSTRCLIRLIG
jgi:hypothetical protein